MTTRSLPVAPGRSNGAAGMAGRPAELPFRIGAPAQRLDLALLRREVAETARRRCAGLSPGRRDDLVLVVNELATNAVRYGGGGLVNIMVAPRAYAVSVRVYDGVAAPPRLKDPGECAEDGRGLHLVDELTGHRWGHRVTPGGKYVWALIGYDLPCADAAGPSAD